MSNYLTCWIDAATALFSQALAGEPRLVEEPHAPFPEVSIGFTAGFGGDCKGDFTVALDRVLLDASLLGEGIEQKQAWGELLREVAESAAGDLLARTGSKCGIENFGELPQGQQHEDCRVFLLKGHERSWTLLVHDGLEAANAAASTAPPVASTIAAEHGLDLLLDVELEATLRFGCRELPLGEVIDLGPGDVVQLDRTVRDPVDLVVGDKIVARGEVVLVNGNFGLRVIEVATPRRRLESIRCLF
jgi:flagellar motor switch protein FliN